MSLLSVVFSSVAPATDSPADREQVLFHVWTPEPELATATACLDNIYGGQRPDDPNRRQSVPLPASVRDAICDLTSRTFAGTLYEGPTEYADLFGPVHRLTVPDNPLIHMYIYQLRTDPTLSPRYYSIVLILHDIRTDKVTLAPPTVLTDFQNCCPAPWIRFQDVVGDEAMEILLLTGEHRGTAVDWANLHILCIENGLELHEVLTLRTAELMPYTFPGETSAETYGYTVRTLEKLGPNCIRATVSLSRNKGDEGEQIQGHEVWEMTPESSRMHMTARD